MQKRKGNYSSNNTKSYTKDKKKKNKNKEKIV